MTQMVLRIPETQKALLTTQAELANITLSELVRSILDTHLQASSKKKTYTILSDLGKMSKKYGTETLSTNYKKILYQYPNNEK